MVEEQAPLFPTREQEDTYNKFKYFYKHYWGINRIEVLTKLINQKGIRAMVHERKEIEWLLVAWGNHECFRKERE